MLLVTASQMRALDKKAVEAGVPVLILMESAGRALAEQAIRMVSGKESEIAILCGKGQNGGDGFCAARHLASKGYRVSLAFFGSEDQLPDEARQNFNLLSAYPVRVMRSPGTDVKGLLNELCGAKLVIDALLGTGAKGNPRAPMDLVISWANRQPAPILACDIPSGLSPDTGRAFEPCIKADVTVTMGLCKIGLMNYPGKAYAGQIIVEDIGLEPFWRNTDILARAIDMKFAGKYLPERKLDHHKGLSGHVTVIAGSVGMAGAAVLASEACLRSGAGTVTLVCPENIYFSCVSMIPEVMVVPCPCGEFFRPDAGTLGIIKNNVEKSSGIIIGPGLGRGESQTRFIEEILQVVSKTPCVIDADALFAISRLGGLPVLKDLSGQWVLTPHPGELSVLLGVGTTEIGLDRPGFAKSAAANSGNVVCLKGAGTCTAGSGGRLMVNTTGDPAMATAGSGDVLTGVIAALTAQGLSSFDAAWLGVYWHGLSGELAKKEIGSYGMLAKDIIKYLPKARKLIEGR